jgi:2-methylcitrate dehydratase
MDRPTAAIVEFVERLSFDDLSASAVTATKVRALDAYACAWGAVEADPVVAAKRAFLPVATPGRAHLVTGESAHVEVAAFINSLMTRYLDFNDAHEVAYGHPSDMILPLFNVAEELGSSGQEVIVAIAAAYQVACGITLGGGVHYKRWETAFAQGIGTAVGAAMLMKLTPDTISDAVGIATACSSPLNIRKTGSHLSMWKGCAGPQAARMGLQAAALAGAGMQGPDEAFEGARGVFEMITGEFQMRQYLDVSQRFEVENTTIKLYPVSGRVLAPVETVIAMRPEIGDVSAITSIDVQTYQYCFEFEQKDHESLTESAWDPQTREMADHSLRWLLAVALLDGNVSVSSFDDDQLRRTDTRRLVAQMTITEDPQLTARWPQEWVSIITIRTQDGRTIRRETPRPVGSPRNPATPAALENKVVSLVGPHMGPDRARELVQHVNTLETWPKASLLLEWPVAAVTGPGVARH